MASRIDVVLQVVLVLGNFRTVYRDIIGGTTIKKTFPCSQCKIRLSHQPVKFSLG